MSSDSRTKTIQAPAGLASGFEERRRRSRSRVPALTVLYHADGTRVGERALLQAFLTGQQACLSRLEPIFSAPGKSAFRPLEDSYLSRTPIRLLPTGEACGVRLERGESPIPLALDGVPLEAERALGPEEVERGVVLELGNRVVLLLHTLGEERHHDAEAHGLVGSSEALQRVHQDIRRVASLAVPVLLRGETGTGKELVASAIHRAGDRRDRIFASVNMGAVPPTLAASELFGAVKGAYTSSVKSQMGYFQRAHGGTLFLDEVGETPPEVQVLLLRVLETGEIQRVGSQETQRVDVRLIAATDADLERAIAAGSFRAPLLHRLAGYEITIPPLRERRDDFGRLLFHFLREELRAVGGEHRLDPPAEHEDLWLPASVVARLARHSWPGNVRQLRNVARQMVIASLGSEQLEIGPEVDRLLREVTDPPAASEVVEPPAEPRPRRRRRVRAYRKPADVSEEELLEALRANGFQVKPTAAQLGVSRASLYVLIDRSDRVRKARDVSRQEIEEASARFAGDLDAMARQLEVSRSGLQQRMGELSLS